MIKSNYSGRINDPVQRQSLLAFINSAHDPLNLKQQFFDRLKQGSPTRSEDSASHFCAFFAPFDPQEREVFIGHHIKGDRWLFNGGHLDQGETPLQTVTREMQEEWGSEIGDYQILDTNLITVTHISSPNQTCRIHYDLWFFVSLNKSQFKPDKMLLKKEFHRWGWKSEAEAMEICEKEDVQEALDMIFHDLI
mgnify:CR=1 FL=1|jgi:8-oxo-dGTP pyrophosphatase MutT (NUDIX family)